MISEGDSSSEATKSSGDALVTGMMHLAIACNHVDQQSEKEAKAASTSTTLTIFLGSTLELGVLGMVFVPFWFRVAS